jgi:hypothetical protein
MIVGRLSDTFTIYRDGSSNCDPAMPAITSEYNLAVQRLTDALAAHGMALVADGWHMEMPVVNGAAVPLSFKFALVRRDGRPAHSEE